MVRRVLLARGASLPTTNGLGRAHHSIVSVLNRALVPNWTKVTVVEHSVVSGSFSRLFNRWLKHPKKVTSESSKPGVDLLHITDQEQAHLVPHNSSIPVVVTIHDLFHIRPRTFEAGGVYISVGDQKPNLIRKRDILKLKAGLNRADLLICISEETRSDVRKLFPNKQTVLVRNDIDIDYWNPYLNPISRKYISEHDDDSKCLFITVGSNDPRKRLDFIDEVFNNLPKNVKEDINLIKIGSGIRASEKQLISFFQHAEALLFPSISEGFGYPPAEAMAAGCPVIAADLPAHNEVIPVRCLLDPINIDSWVYAIEKIHREWLRSGKTDRIPDDNLITHASELLSPKVHGTELSKAYDIAYDSFHKK
jgi:glycosyltransferase involved in cell wall biosynthesis